MDYAVEFLREQVGGKKIKEVMARPIGFEPMTYGLEESDDERALFPAAQYFTLLAERTLQQLTTAPEKALSNA